MPRQRSARGVPGLDSCEAGSNLPTERADAATGKKSLMAASRDDHVGEQAPAAGQFATTHLRVRANRSEWFAQIVFFDRLGKTTLCI